MSKLMKSYSRDGRCMEEAPVKAEEEKIVIKVKDVLQLQVEVTGLVDENINLKAKIDVLRKVLKSEYEQIQWAHEEIKRLKEINQAYEVACQAVAEEIK